MAQQPLSLRAYAAHRKSQGFAGGSLQAVQRAIQGQRLLESIVTIGGVKKVADPELADREWVANTDLSRAPGTVKDMAGFTDGSEAEQSPLVVASAREKHWKAELAELDYRKRSGELVPAADVETTWSELCTTLRSKFLSLPSRMKQAHDDLTLAHLATLEDLVREILKEVAEDDDTQEST